MFHVIVIIYKIYTISIIFKINIFSNIKWYIIFNNLNVAVNCIGNKYNSIYLRKIHDIFIILITNKMFNSVDLNIIPNLCKFDDFLNKNYVEF